MYLVRRILFFKANEEFQPEDCILNYLDPPPPSTSPFYATILFIDIDIEHNLFIFKKNK